MKVLVIGELNEKLVNVLNKAQKDGLIESYLSCSQYNQQHALADNSLGIIDKNVSMDGFVALCKDRLSFSELGNEWIILKGDIHTKDFLKYVINWDKSLLSGVSSSYFLSHVVHLVNKRNPKQNFYLTDGALNVSQSEDSAVFQSIVSNAKTFISEKRKKLLTEVKTSILLAASNNKVPGYKLAKEYIETHIGSNTQIQQFDECFDLSSWLIKNKQADALSFTYPDLVATTDITTANCIWKSLTILNDWYAEGIILGTQVLKIILLSRSDSEESYYNSIKALTKGE